MMGLIKMAQALCGYTAGLYYVFTGNMEMAMLCYIAGVLCDIGHTLEEKE